MIDDLHAQGLRSQGRGRADAPYAHDAEGFSAQTPKWLGQFVRPRGACIVSQTIIQKVKPSGQGQGHADGRVRYLFAPVVRDVGNVDAPFPGEDVVDVVVTYAAAYDQATVGKALDRRARDGYVVVDHDCVGVLHLADQVILAHRLKRLYLGNIT